MKLILILAVLFSQLAFSQVVKDLDGDGKEDYVDIDETGMIVCKLSSQNYKPIESISGFPDELNSGVQENDSGFEYAVNFMRAGYALQFRYEPKDKQIRLIGMSRYEFGPANNDGSGESSVNLLTNNYIGEWNYWDEKNQELKKIPAIKKKMFFPKIFLQNPKLMDYFFQYQSDCADWFNARKKALLSDN